MANINKLIKQLKHDDPSKREEAILELAELQDQGGVEPLIKVVNQDTRENRTYAITALAEIGDHRAIETLIFCLMDNDENIRLAASRALGKFISPQAISSLLVSLKKDPNITVKSRAALSLGAIGSELAVEDLLQESKLEHPSSLLYSIDSALKMIAKNNGYENIDALVQSLMVKKTKRDEVTPELQQINEREELLRFPNLWPYIRKYVFQQLEGIQTVLSIESNEETAERKITEILGGKFYKFIDFMERKMNTKYSEYQTDLLWQMSWDTSKPIRTEIFQMIRDHRSEVAEIDRYRGWLEKIEEEKEAAETEYGEPIMRIEQKPTPPPREELEDVTAAELARSISGDIESIMKKYSTWKGEEDEEDDFKQFNIETK
ncbi:MAG: HEAT repeat domain-containing protein [Candidatus Heimdallarchaeota archaeon]|nr:HEAT repeat domain-containing protein [Candidatus Heimdallarchaeota archaeon]MCK4954823.1 HEAT repeat domain-containing protein [Candidatus Heimdallarchaeota archaeon]